MFAVIRYYTPSAPSTILELVQQVSSATEARLRQRDLEAEGFVFMSATLKETDDAPPVHDHHRVHAARGPGR